MSMPSGARRDGGTDMAEMTKLNPQTIAHVLQAALATDATGVHGLYPFMSAT
jgi:hypothetical protein